MKLMSSLTILVAATLAAPVQPWAGSVEVGARIGDSFIRAGDSGVQARINIGTRASRQERRERRRDRFDRRDRVLIVPVRERTVVRREEVPVPVPVAVPVPPEPEPEAVPLDPSGAGRIVSARGRVAPARVYELGTRLPPDQPHVTLDHRRYDLPEPPPGQIYARVGRDVLRIDPATREIFGVVGR